MQGKRHNAATLRLIRACTLKLRLTVQSYWVNEGQLRRHEIRWRAAQTISLGWDRRLLAPF
jgi:hypothetical protein